MNVAIAQNEFIHGLSVYMHYERPKYWLQTAARLGWIPNKQKQPYNPNFEKLRKNHQKYVYQHDPIAILATHQVKGGESSSQLRWFTIVKIEL